MVSPSGVETEFFVGDAVEDVIALRNGRIAVTYFDEGFGQPMSESTPPSPRLMTAGWEHLALCLATKAHT